MSKLREAYLEGYREGYEGGRHDEVQVVRCKDCKYHSWGKYCKLTGDPEDIWNDDDFCSFGERKEK